ncbi:MAG: type VI secretion system baseplate subunit TssG [Geminicoccaceae bacterium]
MSTPPPPADLRELAARPERFDFFAAVRLIEAAFPDRARLGDGRRAIDEPLRLGQPPHLTFPPADIAAYEPGDHGRPARLQAYLLGLFGPHGPLPLHVTAHARERARRDQDATFADFCDLFHHRMLSFFYRAWANARPTVQQDRPDRDRFAGKVGTLAGLATPAFARRHALPDRYALYGVGLLSQRQRPPEALARLVGGFLGVATRVEEFIGEWLEVPRQDRARLGRARLGLDAILGSFRYERGHRFRLVLGPMRLAEFTTLLPDGKALKPLAALAQLAAGPELDWDTRLVLRRAEVPPLRLDGRARLGWTSWLHTHRRPHDAGDLVLNGGRYAEA